MSISSTGLYGSATIVNSDLFTDVETLKEQVTTLSTTYLQTTEEHRTDISQNRADISSNLSKINDISNNIIVFIETNISDLSNNRIVAIEQDITDISNNRIVAIEQDITDISNNRIVAIEQDITDISNNRIVAIEQDITDISNNRIVAIETDITDISNNRIKDIEDDVIDISSNKKFIRDLQSVNYSMLLANAPAKWPNPVIQEGYNAVIVNNEGVNIISALHLKLIHHFYKLRLKTH